MGGPTDRPETLELPEPSPVEPEPAPERVGRYLIEHALGRGGMGVVYAARDTVLGRRVALKLMKTTNASGPRLLREARAAAAFSHPNAVVLHDVGESEGATFLVMELVSGRTLRSFVGDDSIPWARKVAWVASVARALGAAHRVGLVHRDVKPDNVMITDDGVAKVLDFGIARQRPEAIDGIAPTQVDMGGTLTAAGVVVGTPLYLSPEQLRNEELDGRSDQFGWGVTAYELLAGRPPWTAPDNLTLLSLILSGPPPPLDDASTGVPGEVQRVIRRALEKQRADRYATMEEVADALDPFADAQDERASMRSGSPGTERVETAPRATSGSSAVVSKEPAPRGSVSRARVAIGMACVVVASGVAATWMRSRDPAAPAAAVTPVIAGDLACGPAALRDGRDEPLARALGIGACARLAGELGVDWNAGGAGTPVAVELGTDPAGASVVLRLAGAEARASGATPIEAAASAARDLARRTDVRLAAPADWGTSDSSASRRIPGTWTLIDITAIQRPDLALAVLSEAYPDSPWPDVLIADATSEGSELRTAAMNRARARLAKASGARADALRGFFISLDGDPRTLEGLNLLRRGAMALPDDPAIAALATIALLRAGMYAEGVAQLDRLSSRYPARAIRALRVALVALPTNIIADNAWIRERLVGTLPEAAAWHEHTQTLLRLGRVDDARAALAIGERLGTHAENPSRAWLARGQIAMLERRPSEAREAAAMLLADPRQNASAAGAAMNVNTFLLQGRIREAQSLRKAEIERQIGTGNPMLAVMHTLYDLRHRRWLQQSPASRERVDWLEAEIGKATGVDWPFAVGVRTEVALARLRVEPAAVKAGTKALAEIDAWIERRADGDPVRRDEMRTATLGLVREARGAEAAAERWRAARDVTPKHRLASAFEAGLALEAAGDREGARAAYELVTSHDARVSAWDILESVAADVRLARLHRDAGDEAAAAACEARVQLVWAEADPGLVDRVRSIR